MAASRRAALALGAGALLAGCGTLDRARRMVGQGEPPDLLAEALKRADATPPALFTDTTLTAPDGRVVKVRLAAPAKPQDNLGFIAFSHGANSSGALYDAVIGPIAAAGYLVAAPTHVDSEGNPDRAKFDQAAVQATRLVDMRILLDRMTDLAAAAPAAKGRIGDGRIAVAGHSYGALIAQQLIGASVGRMGAAPTSARDGRARCAVAISPPGPVPGFLDPSIWDGLAAPMIVTTGTKDTLPNFRADWKLVLTSFERTPAKPAYAVVAPDVDHYFGGLIGRLTVPGPRQTGQLALTAAACIAFLDAQLKGEADGLNAMVAAGSRSFTGLTGPFEVRART
jgi:dienelactone hydrolase